MYVTIRHYDGVKFPDRAATKVREGFLPIVSKIQGFQEYYAIRVGDDSVVSVSVFTDRPGADESVRTATKWVEQNLSEFLPNPPQIMAGETIAHTSIAGNKTAA